jgi:hypothetical protein
LTLVPIRDLGALGVNTDVDPFDLPPTAFTMALNVNFIDKRVVRGPVFRTTGALTNTVPRYVMNYVLPNGDPRFLIANRDGTVHSFVTPAIGSPPTITDVSESSWVASNYDSPYTQASLNDVVYLNRPDRVPWYRLKGGSTFTKLPTNSGNGWDSTWRAAAFRSIAGVCVALNITKGVTAYPTMVKTSDFMTFGNPASTWVAATNNSATENVIADLQEPLVDGLPLRERLIIYTLNETWAMEPRQDSLMFTYRNLFHSAGLINQNCVAEYNNRHYVFGNDDIWTHDGYNRKSIAAGRVRSFIYDNMVRSSSSLFFAVHKANVNEIQFYYVSADSFCAFPVGGTIGFPGCNRVAVYNYRSDCWYFYDAPYVTATGLGTPSVGAAFDSVSAQSYNSVGGAYSTYSSDGQLSLLAVSPTVGDVAAGVRSFEPVNSTSANGPIDSVATQPAFIEKRYIDLDDLGEPLRGYKVVKAIYPEGRFDPASGPITFQFAATDSAITAFPDYGPGMTYDGNTLYKMDFVTAGRFLCLKATYSDYRNFTLSGFDFDYDVTGRR